MPMKEKSIMFIQLPLTDHSMGYIQGNVPCAGAVITAYIKTFISPDQPIEQLPYMLSNFASDRIIVSYIVKKAPDIICFTSYLWNAERNLRIAELVKAQMPACTVLFGGPETAAGSAVLAEPRSCVDMFISGEGEWFFSLFLEGKDPGKYVTEINGNRVAVQPAGELLPAERIVEPFTAGFLEPMPDSSVFIEMTRGCPYRCSYCYYSRNCPGVRELPFDTLLKAMEQYERISEIYILSPTFDRSRDFLNRLKILEKNNFGISLHTEMRADRIDRETAGLLKRAGFNSMEVGLQTLNPDVLKRIRRNSDTEAELRGMAFMQEAGIDLKIGIIPGLPGDSPESFHKTAERLVSLGFGDSIEFYPLMILPGTGIREEADAAGISYQKKAPYFYLDGWGMNAEDIRSAADDLEISTGFGQSIISLPDFTLGYEGELVRAVSFDGRNEENWVPERYRDLTETACFDFHITCSDEAVMLRGMERLLKGLPEDILYTFIFYSDTLYNEGPLAEMCSDFMKDSILSRMNLFGRERDGSTFRFFQIFTKTESFRKALDSCYFTGPVMLVNDRNHKGAEAFLEQAGPDECFALAGKELNGSGLTRLMDLYRNEPDMIAFETRGAMRKFAEISGQELVETGFELRKVRF